MRIMNKYYTVDNEGIDEELYYSPSGFKMTEERLDRLIDCLQSLKEYLYQ